jgi:hypothetical protein
MVGIVVLFVCITFVFVDRNLSVRALTKSSSNTLNLLVVLSVRGDVKLFDFGLARGEETVHSIDCVLFSV